MSEFASIRQLIDQADHILIVQADNPDGDSLGSALALEAIFEEHGKKISLYCGAEMPDYLKYLEGWSRVSKELPAQYDLSILVDVSTKTLFERAVVNGIYSHLATKPSIVLDHHAETLNDIEFATVVINDGTISSTCELIYSLLDKLELPLPRDAIIPLATGILGDTQGLANQLAKPETYRIMAKLVESGLDRPALEEIRRQYSKMPQSIYKFKSRLIERTTFEAEGRIAYVSINQQEINAFSPLYNPGPLIQTDMLQVQGVDVGIVFKVYDDGKVTGMIRCNPKAEIANKIALSLGGGGHGFAAGFKVADGRSFADIKTACLTIAQELLDKE